MAKRILTALPVYNEAETLDGVLQQVRRYSPEILVVNDGSTDGTAEKLAAYPDIHVITHRPNQGYGGALRSAFQFALENRYDALVTIDCDGQHQPELIPSLVAALDQNGCERDVISGSRYLKSFDGQSTPPEDRRRINMLITEELNSVLGLRLTDAFCGFKAYRVSSLKNIEITELGYAMPLQFWVQAVALGLSIKEFPVPLVYLDASRSFGGSLDDSDYRLKHYREILKRELAATLHELPPTKKTELDFCGCDGYIP